MVGIITPIVGITTYIILATIGLLISFFSSKGPDVLHNLGRLWSKIIFKAARSKIDVRGQEHIPHGTPVVFASNHQSQFDIPALYLAIPIQFRFVVKKELFKIPLFGLAMKRAGYVPIDRTGGKKAVKSLRAAVRRIKSGTSVVVFPEGTRSPDGKLLPFKTGALLVALKSGVPIVPIGIKGTHKILPKGSLWVRPGEVQVSIGRPIDTTLFQGRDAKDELVRVVRQEIARLID
ncbi:1-acyl-sn-glycerol-3-phosphate acyltransferase [Dissulfuribacter thermophilus]|uniref:1-acyl-sn-glycerol-3-phosphate acyltransferase n=1 Tax=Dissulfuribacter thermophilus TaxID=1156395 RepID=A0A1B9F9H3_9BACT|nr:lysophospholipid acyltransferase family protein [Dissulfuribacter thermophilus]OCC16431.1 1-acyl-sn-glycerol-3-phosphate acyltransferase [Dissulfuribacter thermophilus]